MGTARRAAPNLRHGPRLVLRARRRRRRVRRRRIRRRLAAVLGDGRRAAHRARPARGESVRRLATAVAKVGTAHDDGVHGEGCCGRLGIVRAHDMKLRRTGTPSRTKEHPGYEPIQHVALEQTPFEVVTEGLEFTVDDVIEILRYRKRVAENCERREKMVKAVIWWRSGKPPRVIREE